MAAVAVEVPVDRAKPLRVAERQGTELSRNVLNRKGAVGEAARCRAVTVLLIALLPFGLIGAIAPSPPTRVRHRPTRAEGLGVRQETREV